jgi:hypothetical protein
MRRIVVFLNLVALIAAWVLASQTWAATTVIDTQNRLSISGLDAYPQLSFLLITGLLILWLTRYLNSVFSKFLTSAVVVLLMATSSPVWFDSAAGSVSILNQEISKVTGVSDWLGQSTLIEKSYYNHFMADVFVISLMIWCTTLVYILWSKRPGESKKEFVTRIDKLPSW